MARIGVIGGSRHLGKAIARRLVKAVHHVTIGSRSAEKAQTVGTALGAVRGAANDMAATGQDIPIVTVPYASQTGTLQEVAPTNSAAAEALTSILIYMNQTYGANGAGVRFTALTAAPACQSLR